MTAVPTMVQALSASGGDGVAPAIWGAWLCKLREAHCLSPNDDSGIRSPTAYPVITFPVWTLPKRYKSYTEDLELGTKNAKGA